MSAHIDIHLDMSGLNELMRSSGVQALVDAEAQKIQALAGEEFKAKSVPHKWTARAYVTPKSPKGWAQEAKDGRLSRAVGANAT